MALGAVSQQPVLPDSDASADGTTGATSVTEDAGNADTAPVEKSE